MKSHVCPRCGDPVTVKTEAVIASLMGMLVFVAHEAKGNWPRMWCRESGQPVRCTECKREWKTASDGVATCWHAKSCRLGPTTGASLRRKRRCAMTRCELTGTVRFEPKGVGLKVEVGDSDQQGSQGRILSRDGADKRIARTAGVDNGCRGFWGDADLIWCTDQKYRAVEPGSFPLAHGATARVGRLRAYGNAIVAPLAEEFVRAYLETEATT